MRATLLAAAAVVVCVSVCAFAAANSRAPGKNSLLSFSQMWVDENNDENYDDDTPEPVVRDSVIGHAEQQLNILRGHLNRSAFQANC
jgi:HAMP domain-containing protein